LLEKSGLPGPRGNLELAQVVADEGDLVLFQRYASYTVDQAPVNSPYEFLAFCGVLGMGQLIAGGNIHMLAALRIHASDPRWRIREAVAMALQRLGDVNMGQLIGAMQEWSNGNRLEQRAAAAALCEPRLLLQPQNVRAVLYILNKITETLSQGPRQPCDEFLILRKGLGYCWSVAVAALPNEGKALMEKWLEHSNPDVQWVMRENLKKARLARIDPNWVRKWQERAIG